MSQIIGRTHLAHARSWHLVNASSTALPLGRLASQIAVVLMGKHKPMYNPSSDMGDYVVAIGCNELHVTGKKKEQKLYRTHTTRPGSLKEMSMERVWEKWGGGEVLRRAVRGMLPKNRLRDERLKRLKCFEGTAHPYRGNILRNASGSTSIGQLPQVQAALHETAEQPVAVHQLQQQGTF